MKLGRGLMAGVLALFLLASCSDPEPIRVGFIGELTGNSADLGEAGRNGTMLAIEEANQNGGIKGQRLELLVRGTGNTPESAINTANELIQAKVVAIIGPMTSGMATALLPAVDAAQTVMISPTASAFKLSGQDDYLFRINWTTRDNARLYAQHCLAQGYRRIAAAANQNNRVFSESWLQELKLAFEQGGGKIVALQYFDSASESQMPIVERLLQSTPDALVFIANAADSAGLAQQTRKLNKRIPLLAAEWASTDQLIELGGQAVENMAVVQQFDADDKSPRFTDFYQRYRKRFGREPAYASVLAHDAASVLLDTLARRSSDMPLKTALIDKGPFQGIQETIHFDSFGDTRRNARIAIIQNGRFVRQP